MKTSGFQYVYGPVPSRRLGRSLGIDLVPFKTCTYDCVYCQLGRTTNKAIERQEYVPVEDVVIELQEKLAAGDAPDYIGLAGSGEPTLNSAIGDLIHKIKGLTDIPVAVLTNGSLLWMSEVQDALMGADLVLPSLDAGDARLFRYVNRPHEDISFEQMVDGIAAFTERFPGEVWLEVFLLAGVTGVPAEVEKIAVLTRKIRAARVQLNTVSRPPCEDFARAVPRRQLESFVRLFGVSADVIGEGPEGKSPTQRSGLAVDEEILALLSRRPCCAEDIAAGLGLHVAEVTKALPALLAARKIKETRQDGRRFYLATGIQP